MTARSPSEQHRASTPLELLFDLCFVVAVAQSGVQLVHFVAEGQQAEGVINFAMIFFATWWAWMNFTWFASAYDNDDVVYRLVTLIQIAGVLIMAAGISRAAVDHDFAVCVLGYLVMRFAMCTQWLRVALSTEGTERRMALRYLGGVLACQAGWTALLWLPSGIRPWVFVPMVLAELAVPAFAERLRPTTWHPDHIAERYGLFTIIVLGESIAAATVAVKSALEEHDALGDLLPIAAGGLLIVFAAWWIYFAVPIQQHLASNRQSFVWGYGHYLVFTSAAAIGAGIEVAVEEAVGKSHISTSAASAAVTIPAAVFMLMLWSLHARHFKRGLAEQLTLPLASVALLACTFTGPLAVLWAGVVATVTVAAGTALNSRRNRAGS